MSVRKILVVLGGDPPGKEILDWRMEESDLIIAVDSGWHAFRNAGISPDILIGDMDSWMGKESEVPKNVEIIVEKDQNSTDFQKTIQLIFSREDPKELLILGGLGNRSDHLLSNLLVVCKIPQNVKVTFDSRLEWIQRVTADTPLIIKGQQGATISLLPGSPCVGVSSTGLKWELDYQDFSFEGNWSQSNICSSNEIKISVRSGNLLVFLQK